MKRALLLLSLLASSTACAQGSPRTVTIGLGYIPNVQFTPFYVADKLGYYRAEGVNVKFQHGYVSELMPLLLQGKLDFVVGDPEDAVFARNQGAPVRYVMAMYQKSPVTVFSTRPLNRASDLKGKTLGIPGTFGSSYAATRALLDAADLREGRDVRLASIGFTQLEAVRAGRVDAAVGYLNNEVVGLRQSGERVYTLDLSAAYPMVGVGLITLDKTLGGDLARKVVRASQRGLKFTVGDPARAFRLAQPVFGTGGGSLEVLRASVPLMQSAYTRSNGLGASDPAAWTKAVAALVKQGSLPAGTKASTFYTNSLISKTLR
ncbi:NitT/TauT family transport system substrate-binding protein [Deinococcus sp. HSC-46F16]|uniref:ABC transporter substrate-binding protein n=1 Tax=Deinococcus sp. HSC-46F16 TaxID=2910968 RepID=UPI00209C790A|nr:ABC transporter substrate-binding protein [Deinococcus sp. HSC-46F16]MCP2015877.1 NitT/TauT family transport system substrate-binding protein [Deinococcus sp. HSC-46F16]